MKDIHGRDLSGEELAQLVDEFVNGAGDSEVKAFADQITQRTHRTLQQKIMGLFLGVSEQGAAVADKPNFYDARNEATVKLAAKMLAAAGDKYERHLPCV